MMMMMMMMMITTMTITMAHTPRWCSGGDAKEEVGPGKQAVLCQGRTAHEVGA